MRNGICASVERLQTCRIINVRNRASCNNLQRLRANKAQEDRPPKATGDFLPQHSLDGTQSSGVRQTERVWAMHVRSFSRVYSRGFRCCFVPPDIPAVFLPFWDIAGRFLAFLDIPAVFWLYGAFLTPLESGFKSRPRERTPLHRSDVGPAPPDWTRGANRQAIFAIFRATRTYLQFSGQQGGPLCNFTQTGSRTGVFIRRANRSTPSQRRGTSPEDLRERILERQTASSFAGTRERLASVGEEKSLWRGSPRESFAPLEALGFEWRVAPLFIGVLASSSAGVRDPAGVHAR
ncbi:hypothetical protein Taro_003085, partial [Colocasia esculenta]|nr:hypothetical protein [Colocasia esculenta]